MEKQYWLFDATTRKYLRTNFFAEQPENSVDFEPTVTDAEQNAVLNQEGTAWVDCRSEYEINKEFVPEIISRMNLKIQLLLKGIAIEDIIDTINSIPSYMFPDVAKQIAIIKLNEAAYFDRYNADLQLVATLMGLSQTDLDDIFIKGNQV